ncbi:hypothetical protein GCM10011608_05990 [Micromonospora sonchi]|uniref:Uncharacterized protein n=1 Tax=Micromonospora sonchi TaxID=1763543 RepID=A0A917TIC9_9ACTN|nr:hypothetical protein GCM10011608_05990 [Micromonospora sonchi]
MAATRGGAGAPDGTTSPAVASWAPPTARCTGSGDGATGRYGAGAGGGGRGHGTGAAARAPVAGASGDVMSAAVTATARRLTLTSSDTIG